MITFSADVRTKPAVGCIAIRLSADSTKLLAIAAKLQTLFGINLAGSLGLTLHGHLSGISKLAGAPFLAYVMADGTRHEVDICQMCDTAVARAAAHSCVEIVLYTEAQAPNADHSTTFAPHGLSALQLAALAATDLSKV